MAQRGGELGRLKPCDAGLKDAKRGARRSLSGNEAVGGFSPAGAGTGADFGFSGFGLSGFGAV